MKIFTQNNTEDIDIDIDIKEEIQTDLEESIEDNKQVVVYNDDINTFDHVIFCFISYCNHTEKKATLCAIDIHEKGKSIVMEGSFDKLRPIRNILCSNGLSAEIENSN